MSSIIKNSNLIYSEPRIIEANHITTDERYETDSLITNESINGFPEEDPIEALREESNSILAETEKLIIDLLEKARLEAKSIINEAQEDADYIRSQAMEESKSIRENAGKQGYAEGLKKAQDEIEADRQMAMDQSGKIIEEARRTKIEMLNNLETDMVRLVLAISKKVIASELLIQPEVIVEIVRQAISNLDDPDRLRIYLNPADIALIMEAIDWGGLTEIGSRDVEIEVKGDPRISQGGSVIEATGGTVDARLETRIQTVEKSFLDVVNE